MRAISRQKEDERILSVQLELFPSAEIADIEKALHVLKQYPELKIVVEDYREHEEEIRQVIYEGEIARKLGSEDLYSNKTANAVIVAMNQKQAAEECETIQKAVIRAVNLIADDDARLAVKCRYLMGKSYGETLRTMYRGEKSSTMDRKLKYGIASVANTLKLWGIIT